jgi:hypothetical protein
MFAAAVVPTDSPKERAEVWAKGLSTAELRAHLQADRILGLPIDYRVAVFDRLSTAEDRIKFWHSVYSSYRQRHVLSDQEQATLSRAEKMIEVMFLAPESERQVLEASLTRMSDEVLAVLGEDARVQLFKSAGPDGRTETLPGSERLLIEMRRWARGNVMASALKQVAPSLVAAGNCNCSDEEDGCNYESHCTKDLNQCTHSGGCSCDFLFFNCWTCDGVCNYGALD